MPLCSLCVLMLRKNFSGIQALRGIAACMVVLHHASEMWGHKYGGWVWENGASGVDIFFVISGFVMAISAKKTAGQFLKNRVIRVVPLYWIMTALMLVKLAVSRAHPTVENVIGRVDTPVSYVLSSLFFIPYTNSLGLLQPALAQGWTLNYEMFFYLLFSVALFLQVDAVKFLAPVLIAIGAFGFFHPMGLINPIVLEFLFGMLLAKMPRHYAFPGVIAFLCLCFFPASVRSLQWGIPAFFVVMAATQWDRVPRLLLSIGDASYSLYLSHLFVLLVVFKAIPRTNEVLMLSACTLLSVGAALLVHEYVEKPLTELLKNYLSPVRFQSTQLAKM